MCRRSLLAALLLPLFLAACARIPLSEEALSRIDPTVEFADIKANPERHQGRTVLLGGQIVDNQATREGSVLEILRYRLNSSGRPVEVDEFGGRFLARSDRFLDPEVYEKGKFITLTGTVLGQQTKPLKEIDYTYPVFQLGEAYLWREQTYYGYPGPYPYPYYYGPWYPYYYDPFWYPFGPPGRFHDPFLRHPWWW